MTRSLAIASVTLNAILAGALAYLLFARTPAPTRQAPQPVPSTNENTLPPANKSSVPIPSAIIAASDSSWNKQGISGILAELRRLKAPPEILLAVANSALTSHYAQRRAEILDPNRNQRWRRSYPDPSKEQQEQLLKLRTGYYDDLRTLLGSDYEAAVSVRSGGSARFGTLSAEKIALVSQIEADYTQIRTDPALRKPGVSLTDLGAVLEDEKQADLAGILTAEELADYRAFNSRFADQLQGRLRGADLNDDQYRKIYDAAAAHREQFYASAENAKLPEQAAAYRLGEITAVRAASSAEVAAAMALQQDTEFRRVMAAYGGDERSPDKILDAYHQYLRFFAEMDVIQPRSKNREETYRLARPAAEQAYASLTAGLSAAEREKFDQTKFGQLLARHRNPPSGG